MSDTHIAVLMTCHNRREKTLSSLESLQGQRGLPDGTHVRIHLVDASSSDGTARAVAARFPDVDVVTVGADVFWSTGMRIASQNSRRPGLPDWTHQLWLNDDVVLTPGALGMLLDTASDVGGDAVLVGAVHATDGTRTTYSGYRSGGRPRWHPRHHHEVRIEPTGRPEPCDVYDGNVVLVPRVVHQQVGDIDRRFRHAIGDHDHALRVRRAGFSAFVAPQHAGACDDHEVPVSWLAPEIGVREALRRVSSQHELPPREWAVFCLRHLWPWAPLLMCSPYLRAVAHGFGTTVRGR